MDMRAKKEPVAALYRVTSDGAVDRRFEDIAISNALAWSPDGATLYFGDTRGKWVDCAVFDPVTGATDRRQRFVTYGADAGAPDGASCDVEGHYWVTNPQRDNLDVFMPSGRLLLSVPILNGRPTMPCFGGAGLQTLYVTSLGKDAAPEALRNNMLIGTVISLSLSIRGSQASRFADRQAE